MTYYLISGSPTPKTPANQLSEGATFLHPALCPLHCLCRHNDILYIWFCLCLVSQLSPIDFNGIELQRAAAPDASASIHMTLGLHK